MARREEGVVQGLDQVGFGIHGSGMAPPLERDFRGWNWRPKRHFSPLSGKLCRQIKWFLCSDPARLSWTEIHEPATLEGIRRWVSSDPNATQAPEAARITTVAQKAGVTWEVACAIAPRISPPIA